MKNVFLEKNPGGMLLLMTARVSLASTKGAKSGAEFYSFLFVSSEPGKKRTQKGFAETMMLNTQ